MDTRFLLALVLAAVGCGEKKPAPVVAAQEFATAMQQGDTKAVIGLLERDAVERLERAAAGASDQVGGRRNIEVYEMLQVVDVPATFQVAQAELVTGTDELAEVAIVAADGSRHVLHMVQQDGQWRVRVPVPGNQGDAT
jgi:hypothetical protein